MHRLRCGKYHFRIVQNNYGEFEIQEKQFFKWHPILSNRWSFLTLKDASDIVDRMINALDPPRVMREYRG